MRFVPVFSRFLPVPPRRASAPTTRPAALFCTLVLGMAVFLPGFLRAQTPGALDTTTAFTSFVSGSTIFTANVQGPLVGEQIFVGGDADGFGVLNLDGTASSTFVDPLFGNEGRLVYTIVPQTVNIAGTATSTILVGGVFGKTKANKVTTPSRNILRLTLNQTGVVPGTLDTTFDPGHGANDFVTAIIPQSDGSIIVGGKFTEFNNQSYSRIVKLTVNGAIDTTFKSLSVDDGVLALAAEIDPATGAADGKIIMGGTFSVVGGSTYTKLARVTQTGDVDPAFHPVLDERVLTILSQPDGKILIGGQFATVNGTPVGHLARLNQDGSLDTTFNGGVDIEPDGIVDPVAVYALTLEGSGRIYVGGNFAAVDGVPRQYLGLLESNGSLVTAFDPGVTITNSVQSVSLQADTKVLVGETVSRKINNVFPPSLIRLYGDGVLGLSSVNVNVKVPTARAPVGGARTTGKFQLVRSGGDLTVPLTVYYTIGGSAQPGVAYRPVPDDANGGIYSVTFAANQAQLNVKVKPLVHDAADAPQTATLTLLPSQTGTNFYITTGLVTSGTVEVENSTP